MYDDRMTDHDAGSQPVDTVYSVTAPENATFQRWIAGPFIRAFAYGVDVIAISLWWLISIIGANLLLLSPSWINSDWIVSGETVQRVMICLIIFNALLTVWFWNALWEAFWRGRTIGKAVMGLRTITTGGRPITFAQALLRNILRSADLFMGPFAVLIMAFNDRMARLGDLAAGTIVVNERLQKKSMTKTVFHEQVVMNVAANIPDEFVVPDQLFKALSLYVSRRLALAPARRYETAAPLAAVLLRKCGFAYRIDPDIFLCALYTKALGETGTPEDGARLRIA